jgi:tetratricopeptide (TPR) repeat protein
MLPRPFVRTRFCLAALALLAVVAGCGGGGRLAPATPRDAPVAGVPPTGDAVQALFESGRYRELLSSAGADTTSAEAIWFAAQSHLRLGQPEEARRQFERLPSVGAGPAWQVVSDLALAILNDDFEALDRARAAAAQFPDDPFVQFELGLAHARRNDFAGAAQAFDRCTQANPRFAYAYYNSGLAYDRLNRSDLMTNRLEMFQRLAPAAPERAEVETILRAVRGR